MWPSAGRETVVDMSIFNRSEINQENSQLELLFVLQWESKASVCCHATFYVHDDGERLLDTQDEQFRL